MFRALVVLFAGAWLAVSPPAAAAASSSHKPAAHKPATAAKGAKAKSAKHADDSPPSRKARLRRGDDDAVAAASRSRAAKGAKSARGVHAKTTHKGEQDDADTPSPKPAKGKATKHGGKAEVTDADDETPSPSKARTVKGRHVALVETPTLRRAEAKAESGCEAKAAKGKGRHKRSAKARAAALRTCLAEAKAAARRAAEEAAARIATWSRPPLVYAGAMPHPAATVARSSAPADPTAVLGAPADSPGVATTEAGATTGQGAAGPGVHSAQPPNSGGGFFGLFGRRKPDAARPGGPAPTVAGLIGDDEAKLKAALGDPELTRAEGGGALWTYRLPACALYVFLGRADPSAPWQVKGAQAGPLKRGQPTPDADACLRAGRP